MSCCIRLFYCFIVFCIDSFPVWSGRECEDIYRRGGKDSQLYMIQPDAFTSPYKVFCDQTTQRGGEDDTIRKMPIIVLFCFFAFNIWRIEGFGILPRLARHPE